MVLGAIVGVVVGGFVSVCVGISGVFVVVGDGILVLGGFIVVGGGILVLGGFVVVGGWILVLGVIVVVGGWILVLVVTIGVLVDVVVLVGVAHFVGNRSIVPHFGLFGIGEVIFISIVFSDFVGEGVLVIVGFSLVVRGVSIVLGNKASCGWRFCRVK